MSVTITTVPTYVIPGIRVALTCAATSGNYVKLWLTACQTESEWYASLHNGEVPQVLFAEGNASSEIFVTFDVPGVYCLTAAEMTRGASAYGGSYEDDPDADDTFTQLSTTSVTVNVGQRMALEIGSGQNTAKLYVYAWGSSTVATTEKSQGEATPRIDDWSSERAKLAARSSTVVAKLAAMAGVSATVIGAIATLIDNLIDKINAHRSQAGVHANNDSDNAIDASYKVGSGSLSVERMVAALAQAEIMLLRHMHNDSGTGPGSATSDYHTAADNKRAVISDGAGDARTMVAKLADLRRIYDAHRAEGASIHASADSTNTLSAGSALTDLHEAMLSELATTTPTTPSTEHAAVSTLIALGGFAKS